MNKLFNKPDYFYLAIALTFTTLVISAVVTTVDVFKAEKKISRFEEGLVVENEQLEELNFENLEVTNSSGGEVKNVIADANDKRKKSFDDWSQDVSNNSSGNPSKEPKNLSNNFFERQRVMKREKKWRNSEKIKIILHLPKTIRK